MQDRIDDVNDLFKAPEEIAKEDEVLKGEVEMIISMLMSTSMMTFNETDTLSIIHYLCCFFERYFIKLYVFNLICHIQFLKTCTLHRWYLPYNNFFVETVSSVEILELERGLGLVMYNHNVDSKWWLFVGKTLNSHGDFSVNT